MTNRQFNTASLNEQSFTSASTSVQRRHCCYSLIDTDWPSPNRQTSAHVRLKTRRQDRTKKRRLVVQDLVNDKNKNKRPWHIVSLIQTHVTSHHIPPFTGSSIAYPLQNRKACLAHVSTYEEEKADANQGGTGVLFLKVPERLVSTLFAAHAVTFRLDTLSCTRALVLLLCRALFKQRPCRFRALASAHAVTCNVDAPVLG